MSEHIVFFDFDGVIVDSFNLAYQLMKLKNSNLTATEYRSRFEDNIYHYFNADGTPADFKHSPSVLDFFRQYAPQVMKLEYLQGMGDVVKKLAANYSLVIVSSTPASTIREYLTLHKLESYFQDVLGPEVSVNKTDKLHDYLQEMSLKPTDAIFITDTLGDIREATLAKVACIGVTWGYHNRQTLQKGEPFALADHPNELVDIVAQFFSK